MLKDFMNWLSEKGIQVSDKENERYFSRPLTNQENAYMIENNLSVDTVKSWPPITRSLEITKFKQWVKKQ